MRTAIALACIFYTFKDSKKDWENPGIALLILFSISIAIIEDVRSVLK